MAPSLSKAMGFHIPPPPRTAPEGGKAEQPHPHNNGLPPDTGTRDGTQPHAAQQEPYATMRHTTHPGNHDHEQPTQPQREPTQTPTPTRTRRIRHMRDLRQTSRQILAHATPTKRGSRRDHPSVARRRPTVMDQCATDAPTLQPTQKQQKRRLRASAAHSQTIAESNITTTHRKQMVNHTRRNGTRAGYPVRPD